jgi:hypothetical protein
MAGEALEAKDIKITFEALCGFITSLVVGDGGREVSMLHRAPWIDDGSEMPADAAPHLRRLAGDFFCAPFADASADDAPFHGWPANGLWNHLGTERQGARVLARYALEKTVMGAAVVKELRLVDGHPFLYQRHIFTGGRGAFAASNHANLTLPNGARLSFSPKRWFETPATAQETDLKRGRSILAYPARSDDVTRFPRADGGGADLTRYPLDTGHEDFVIGVEAEGRSFGWTAVARESEGDLYISLRNAGKLPFTMTWHSNGGRYYAPWSRRHKHVLGVEEGVVEAMLGDSNRRSPHPLAASGTPMALKLDPNGEVDVRHVIGSIAWPESGGIVSIAREEGGLKIVGASGVARHVPCDVGFLEVADD